LTDADRFSSALPALRCGPRFVAGAAFVVDHSAKAAIEASEIAAGRIDNRERNLRAIAANPNVFHKLSGRVIEADWDNWNTELLEPYLEIAFDASGATG
jgi:L-fuconolactonase